MGRVKWVPILALTLGLWGCASLGEPLWTPPPSPPPTASPTRIVVRGTPTSVPLTTTPVRGTLGARVCTGFPDGALNVRACPGTECWVTFVLTEGAEVTTGPRQARVDEATWVQIVHPRTGWVNQRYLCDAR